VRRSVSLLFEAMSARPVFPTSIKALISIKAAFARPHEG
jgi:hypothetical protein